MPTVSLRSMALLLCAIVIVGIVVIAALGASVAYIGPLLFFSTAATGTFALLFGRGSS